LFAYIFIGNLLGISIARFIPYFEPVINGNISYEPFNRTPLLWMQALTSFTTFVIGPLWYLFSFEKQRLYSIFKKSHRKENFFLIAGISLALLACLIVVNQWFIQWIKAIEFHSSIQKFMLPLQEINKDIDQQLSFLLRFKNFSDVILTLFTMAFLPAIGEEFLFRGVMQPLIFRILHNRHTTIWVTAIVFSAIHMQWEALIPRSLLGALLGYLCVWGNGLSLPIVFHFLNNAISISLIYLYQKNWISFNLDTDLPAYWLLIPAAISIPMLWIRLSKTMTLDHKIDFK